MNTCSFNVFHDTWNKYIYSITYSINFTFLTRNILIY